MSVACASTVLDALLEESDHALELPRPLMSTVTKEECEAGGGTVEYNPGGYPRHCKGGVHDGADLAY